MTRLLGLTPSIAPPPRERPLARSPAAQCRLARHRCRDSRVVLPRWGLSVYFLLQKLLYVVYCRKKTLHDGRSRRVNQQSHHFLYISGAFRRLYPVNPSPTRHHNAKTKKWPCVRYTFTLDIWGLESVPYSRLRSFDLNDRSLTCRRHLLPLHGFVARQAEAYRVRSA
jgi:hypothetical protein